MLTARQIPTFVLWASTLALVAMFVVALAVPDVADAALKSAAGGQRGGGGFAQLTRYLDRLSSYLIPVGASAAVIGLIGGGVMFMFGNPQATKMLGYVAVGLIIVLASKGLAA